MIVEGDGLAQPVARLLGVPCEGDSPPPASRGALPLQDSRLRGVRRSRLGGRRQLPRGHRDRRPLERRRRRGARPSKSAQSEPGSMKSILI